MLRYALVLLIALTGTASGDTQVTEAPVAPSLPPPPPPFALPGEPHTSALLSFFAPVSPKVHNEECRNDSLRYLRELQNLTLWATQMFDASTKFPEGILAADTYQLGHYDECLEVDVVLGEVVPYERGRRVRGQYCLAKVQFAPTLSTYPPFFREKPSHKTEDEDPFSLEYDHYESAWEKIRMTVDPSKKRRDEFFWSLCIPSSCSARDLQISMDSAMDTIRSAYGIRVDISVEEKMCSTAKETEYSVGDHVVGLMIAISVTVMIFSTAYDMLVYRQRNNDEVKSSRMESFVLIFSAYTNLEKLGKPDRSREMSILHGLRLFSMVFIILGHRCLFSYGGPFYNPEFLEERYRKIQDMFLLNGTLIVDTFFVLSGFLTCYMIFLELGKRKRLNIGMLYLYRWMRLTPVYMMVVAFYATLIDNLDNGPMWKSKMGVERERCQQNWWLNLLYINNYVKADQLCMFQSWYIACDMHYFLIAPLVIYPLWRWRNWKGKIPLATVVIASIIIPFIITFVGKYDGVLRVYISLLEDPNANEHYRNVYIKSHSRAGPYFIGITAAYICYQMKISERRFSKVTMWTVSLIAGFVGLASMFGGWSFYIPGRPYYIWENATYATLHRIAWSMAMCWAILGSITTGFNVLEPILSLDAITPLSRLTYCTFLTHGAVQLYIVSTLRVPQFMSFPRLFWMASGDLVMAFIFALFIHLLFEAPIGGLQKILLTGGKQRRPQGQNSRPNKINELEARKELEEFPNGNGNVNPAYNGEMQAETQEI